MEKYLISTKPFLPDRSSSKPRTTSSSSTIQKRKIQPTTVPDAPIKQTSHRSLTSTLLKTLSCPTNPITHSDSYERHQHVQSSATGHQTGGGGRSGGDWMKMRMGKLRVQSREKIEMEGLGREEGEGEKGSQVLKGVVVWINGWTGEGISNLQLIEVIQQAGGECRPTPSSSTTHIISTSWLSGSKTHAYLTNAKLCRLPHVVSPDWIFACLEKGRRVGESRFRIVVDQTQESLHTILGGSTSVIHPKISEFESSQSLNSFKSSTHNNTRPSESRAVPIPLVPTCSSGEGKRQRERERERSKELREGKRKKRNKEKEEVIEEEVEEELEMPSCGQVTSRS